MTIKTILTVYIIGGIIWLMWSKSQGYATSTAQILIWPITAYRQIRDKNAVAT